MQVADFAETIIDINTTDLIAISTTRTELFHSRLLKWPKDIVANFKLVRLYFFACLLWLNSAAVALNFYFSRLISKVFWTSTKSSLYAGNIRAYLMLPLIFYIYLCTFPRQALTKKHPLCSRIVETQHFALISCDRRTTRYAFNLVQHFVLSASARASK